MSAAPCGKPKSEARVHSLKAQAELVRRAPRSEKNRMSRRRSTRIAICLCVGLLVLIVMGVLSGNVILNNYAKGKVERAFADAHPGYALHLGDLQYAIWANQLVAKSATLSGTSLK